ncbi:hypothetical protein ABPG74_015748 [Tetrahymena malaccensis]
MITDYDESQVLIEITPTTLFKEAFSEYDAFVRLKKLGQAIEKITDILPFENKLELILREKELIRFLFYTRIIIPDQMEMLLDSLYNKFGQNAQFLENCWGSLEYFADLPTTNIQDSKKKIDLSQYESKVLSIKILDTQCAYTFKKWTLEYALLIFETIIKDAIFLNRNDPLILFMHLIQNSEDQEILQNTCLALEQIKSKYPFLWHHKEVDERIQEIFMEKSSKYCKVPEVKRIDVEIEVRKDVKEFLDQKKYTRNSQKKQTGMPLVLLEKTGVNKFLNQDSDDEAGDGKLQRSSSISDLVSQFPRQLEYWLYEGNSDKLMIQKNDFIMESLRMYENVQILLSFILEPKQYQVSRKWAKSNANLHYHIDHPIFYTPTFREDLKELYDGKPKIYNSYFYRSYRTVQLIKNINNYKFLMSGAINIIEIFFSELYCLFQNNQQNISANMEHIGNLMNFFLIQNNETTLKMIIEYNILFNIIPYVDIPSINNFLQKIFCVNFVSKSDVSIETYEKFWQYAKYTQFFEELSKMMLYCDQSKLNMFKCENMYKSQELYDLQKSINKVDVNKVNFSFNKYVPYWPEDDHMFRVDIDRIRVYKTRQISCKLKKAIDSQKKGSEKFGSLVLQDILPQLRKGSIKAKNEETKEVPFNKQIDFKHRNSDHEKFIQTNTEINSTKQANQEQNSRISFMERINSLKNNINELPQIQINKNTAKLNQGSSKNLLAQKQEQPKQIQENLRIPISQIQDSDTPYNGQKTKSQTSISSKKNYPISPISVKNSQNYLSSDMTNLKEIINQRLASSDIRTRFMTSEKLEQNKQITNGRYGVSPFNKNNQSIPKSSNQIYNGKVLLTSNDQGNKKEVLQRINFLYPMSLNQIDYSEIEAEAKNFYTKDVQANDRYSESIISLLFEIYKNIIEQEKQDTYYNLLKIVRIDYSNLIQASLSDKIFSDICQNYFYKIKLSQSNITNSAHTSLKLINYLLTNVEYLPSEEYKFSMIKIMENYFNLQLKIIMNSYAWTCKWQQNQIRIGSIDINCINIFKIDIVKNLRLFLDLVGSDKRKKFIQQIYESTWSAILQLCFENRFNCYIQQEVFELIKYGNSFLSSQGMINLWVKLNVFDFFNQQLEVILLNNKFNPAFGLHNFFIFIKKVVYQLNELIAVRQQDLQQFFNCIKNLSSWNQLRGTILNSNYDQLSIDTSSLDKRKSNHFSLVQQPDMYKLQLHTNRSNQTSQSNQRTLVAQTPHKEEKFKLQREQTPIKFYNSGASTASNSVLINNNLSVSSQYLKKQIYSGSQTSSVSLNKLGKHILYQGNNRIKSMSNLDKDAIGQNNSVMSQFNLSENTSTIQHQQAEQQTSFINTKTSLKSDTKSSNLIVKNSQIGNSQLLKFKIVQNKQNEQQNLHDLRMNDDGNLNLVLQNENSIFISQTLMLPSFSFQNSANFGLVLDYYPFDSSYLFPSSCAYVKNLNFYSGQYILQDIQQYMRNEPQIIAHYLINSPIQFEILMDSSNNENNAKIIYFSQTQFNAEVNTSTLDFVQDSYIQIPQTTNLFNSQEFILSFYIKIQQNSMSWNSPNNGPNILSFQSKSNAILQLYLTGDSSQLTQNLSLNIQNSQIPTGISLNLNSWNRVTISYYCRFENNQYQIILRVQDSLNYLTSWLTNCLGGDSYDLLFFQRSTSIPQIIWNIRDIILFKGSLMRIQDTQGQNCNQLIGTQIVSGDGYCLLCSQGFYFDGISKCIDANVQIPDQKLYNQQLRQVSRDLLCINKSLNRQIQVSDNTCQCSSYKLFIGNSATSYECQRCNNNCQRCGTSANKCLNYNQGYNSDGTCSKFDNGVQCVDLVKNNQFSEIANFIGNTGLCSQNDNLTIISQTQLKNSKAITLQFTSSLVNGSISNTSFPLFQLKDLVNQSIDLNLVIFYRSSQNLIEIKVYFNSQYKFSLFSGLGYQLFYVSVDLEQQQIQVFIFLNSSLKIISNQAATGLSNKLTFQQVQLTFGGQQATGNYCGQFLSRYFMYINFSTSSITDKSQLMTLYQDSFKQWFASDIYKYLSIDQYDSSDKSIKNLVNNQAIQYTSKLSIFGIFEVYQNQQISLNQQQLSNDQMLIVNFHFLMNIKDTSTIIDSNGWTLYSAMQSSNSLMSLQLQQSSLFSFGEYYFRFCFSNSCQNADLVKILLDKWYHIVFTVQKTQSYNQSMIIALKICINYVCQSIYIKEASSSFSLSNISSHLFTGPSDNQSMFSLSRIEVYSNNYIAIATDYGYFDDNCFIQVSPLSTVKNCLFCMPNYIQKDYGCIPYDQNDLCLNSQNPSSFYFYYKQFNECIQVNNPIKYCSQLNPTNINQCEICVSKTRDPKNNCQCYPQYYESNQQDCMQIKCNSICKQCNYNPNNCTECWEPQRDIQKNCQCKDGFYEDNLSLTCLQCSSQCSKCANYSNNCTECGVNRINYPKCQCQAGYKENLLGECMPNQEGCNEDCEICDAVTPSLCIQCKSSEQTGAQCQCQDKDKNKSSIYCIQCQSNQYFDVSQMICSKCDASCQTCSGGLSNQCLSCGYKLALNSQKQCQCEDQNLFINSNGLCEEGFDINDVTLQSGLQVTLVFSEEINTQDLSLLNQGIKLYLTQVSSTNFNQEIVSVSKNTVVMKVKVIQSVTSEYLYAIINDNTVIKNGQRTKQLKPKYKLKSYYFKIGPLLLDISQDQKQVIAKMNQVTQFFQNNNSQLLNVIFTFMKRFFIIFQILNTIQPISLILLINTQLPPSLYSFLRIFGSFIFKNVPEEQNLSIQNKQTYKFWYYLFTLNENEIILPSNTILTNYGFVKNFLYIAQDAILQYAIIFVLMCIMFIIFHYLNKKRFCLLKSLDNSQTLITFQEAKYVDNIIQIIMKIKCLVIQQIFGLLDQSYLLLVFGIYLQVQCTLEEYGQSIFTRFGLYLSIIFALFLLYYGVSLFIALRDRNFKRKINENHEKGNFALEIFIQYDFFSRSYHFIGYLKKTIICFIVIQLINYPNIVVVAVPIIKICFFVSQIYLKSFKNQKLKVYKIIGDSILIVSWFLIAINHFLFLYLKTLEMIPQYYFNIYINIGLIIGVLIFLYNLIYFLIFILQNVPFEKLIKCCKLSKGLRLIVNVIKVPNSKKSKSKGLEIKQIGIPLHYEKRNIISIGQKVYKSPIISKQTSNKKKIFQEINSQIDLSYGDIELVNQKTINLK